MDSIITEIRFALRHLARSPSFSILVILTLALGIGTCTAIFSVVSGVSKREMKQKLVAMGRIAPKGKRIRKKD